MADYNPFGKNINELEKDDLEKLITQEIVEGFYIEYKSDFTAPEKIAKSIASFANTYGGWYFIGVESDKTTNKATRISGFNHTIYKDPVPKIMNPARDLLSHMPLLFYKVIEVSPTHSVFVVNIPEGNETPYIHNNGRIYRRKADASEPEHEKDRYAFDRLVDKGREARKDFSEFCKDNRTFSDSESNVAWLNIYFRPQPCGLINDFNIISPQNLKLLLDTSQRNFPLIEFDTGGGITGNSPFNVAHVSGESVVLRQSDTNNVAFNSQTLQLFPDGSCKIHLPVVGYSPYNSEYLNISDEKVKGKLREIISQMLENKHLLKFANLGDCSWAAVACIKYYLNWLTSLDWNSSLWVRIELTEAWRFVPIVNSEHWVKWVDDLGIPVCSHSSVSIPSDALYLIYSYDDKDEIVNECFRGIFECFGIAPYGEYAALIGDDLVHRAGNTAK